MIASPRAAFRKSESDAEKQPGFVTEQIVSRILAFAILIILAIGWANRTSLPLPDDGIGYWLGIAGSTMMVILLGYPLRKHLVTARWLGSVGFWFRFHMVLGLLGPLAILHHARFTWSSTNAGIALMAMLVVVVSGLVGRFLYLHIHRGYSQRKLEVRELLDELSASRLLLDADGDTGHHVVERLKQLESRATERHSSFAAAVGAVVLVTLYSRLMSVQLQHLARSELSIEGTVQHWRPDELAEHRHQLAQHLARYLRSIREAGGYVLYDRLFRAWHYLHLPLFIFLVAAAILHIIAVHMY